MLGGFISLALAAEAGFDSESLAIEAGCMLLWLPGAGAPDLATEAAF